MTKKEVIKIVLNIVTFGIRLIIQKKKETKNAQTQKTIP